MHEPEFKTTKWKRDFHRTIDQGGGVKIDMYVIFDDPTGVGMVTLGVPSGRSDIAGAVCRAMNELESRL